MKWAWQCVTETDPKLLPTAIRRGLQSTSSSARLGYLELGAKLNKEIGPQTDAASGVRIIMVGPAAAAIEVWRKAAAQITGAAALPEAPPLDELEPAPAPEAASPEVRRRGGQNRQPSRGA